MDDTVGRLRFCFPQEQLNVIVGTLLGDGRLEERSKGVRSYTARLRVHHGRDQKNYVLWKYKVLKNLVSKEPREIVWVNPKRNLREVSWYFHTRSTKEFRFLHEIFYRDRKKVIPREIEELLTPQSIAVWAMDDGAYAQPYFNFNTHGFEVEEQDQLRNALLKRFRIQTALHRDRHQWKIAVNRESVKILLDLISPFVIPTMRYKIEVPVSTESDRNRTRVIV
ncbi:MAG: hypothetical protein HYY99_01485 [Candidatus Colwellbacteria bacterium]|nr:hypothetical protein [Candidatus Colwellbacteria bacterium]MBI3088909.1 hypothetical protein [Candidatus Colwellbacteria bacterium]